MFQALLSVVLMAAQGGNPGGDDKPAAGARPEFGVAELDRDGNPVLRRVQVAQKTVLRQVEVKVGQETKKEQVPEIVTFQKVAHVRLDGQAVQVFQANGKKIAAADVGKLISGPTPVLVSVDGKMVDRFYLRLVREGTLVIVLPPGAVPPPIVPPPALPVPKV